MDDAGGVRELPRMRKGLIRAMQQGLEAEKAWSNADAAERSRIVARVAEVQRSKARWLSLAGRELQRLRQGLIAALEEYDRATLEELDARDAVRAYMAGPPLEQLPGEACAEYAERLLEATGMNRMRAACEATDRAEADLRARFDSYCAEQPPQPALRFRPGEIAQLRRHVGLNQEAFSVALGISVRTLQNWEQARVRPEGPGLALLQLVARCPNILDAPALRRASCKEKEPVLAITRARPQSHKETAR